MSSNENEEYPQPSGSCDEDLSRSVDYESLQSTQQSMTTIPREDGYTEGNTQHAADYMEYADGPQMSGEANQQQTYQQMYFPQGSSVGQIQGDVYPRGQFGQQLQYGSPSMGNTESFQRHPNAQNVYLNPAESYPPVVSTTPPLTNPNQQLYHKPNQQRQQQQQQFGNPYQDSLQQNQQQPLQHQPDYFQQQLLQNQQQKEMKNTQSMSFQQQQYQHQNQENLKQQNQEVTPIQQQEHQLKQHESPQKQSQHPLPHQQTLPRQPLQQQQQQQQQAGTYWQQQQQTPLLQQQQSNPQPILIQPQYQQQFKQGNQQLPPPQQQFQGQYQQYEMNPQNQSQQQYPNQQYYPSQPASGQFPQIHSGFVPSFPVNIPNTQSFQSEFHLQSQQPQPKGQGYQKPQKPPVPGPAYRNQHPLQVQRYPNPQVQHQHLNPVLQVQTSAQVTRYPSPQIGHQDHKPILSNKPVVPAKPYVLQGQRYSNPSMHQLHENLSRSFQPGQSRAFQPESSFPQEYQNPQIPEKHQTLDHQGIVEGQPPPYQNQQTQQEYQEYPFSQQVFHQQQYRHPPQEVLYTRTEEDMQVTGVDEDTLPSSFCLKVTGLSKESTKFTVRQFFENKKRGGPLESLQLLMGNGTALLGFKNPADAERVLKGGPHKLQGNTLKVNIVPDSSSLDTEDNNSTSMEGDSDDQLDDKKLLVLDIAKTTTEDTLKNFLESKADADICNVVWGSDKCSAVVAFKTKLDLQAVIEARNNSKVEGKKLRIKTVGRSRCVKVSGLPPQSTEDSVRYHFENKKRGGPVHTVELYKGTASALVRFENYDVAEKVCKQAHKMYQRDVDVEMYIDTPGFTQEELSRSPSYGKAEEAEPSEMVDSLKVLIQNLHPNTTKDSLINFLEAKADVEVVDVKWGNGREVAIVTLKDQPDLEKLKQSCRTKKLEGRTLTVEMVKRSRSIEVSRLPDKVTQDSVVFYFENKKKSGGGPIEEIRLKPQQQAAVIKFEDFGVAEKVCLKAHKMCQKDVNVEMYIDTPGFTQEELSSSSSYGAAEEAEPSVMEDSLKVLVQNLQPNTNEDSLVNFLEAKSNADVHGVKWGNKKMAAIVTFTDKPDLEKLKQSCRTKKLEGRTLTVEMVKRSRSIEVSRLPDDTTEDRVVFYFENKKKSGGGPIEEIRMKPQQQAAVVKFEDFGALERVCSKSDHKIGGKSVEVVLHEAIPGFTEAESDDEEQLSRSSVSETNPSWKVIIKDVQPLIIWYISKSEEEKRILGTNVQKCNGHIRYLRQQIGSLAEVSSIGEAKSIQKDSWKCQVQDAFRKSVDEMALETEDIDISEARQGMIECLGHIVEDFGVQLCKVQQKICIVGKKDDVRRASLQVKEALAGPKKSKVMEVKSFQAQYLKLSNVEMKAMEDFPSVSIDVDSNGNNVNLEGPTRDLDQVQLWLHQKLSKICSKSHSFKTDLAVGIMKSQSFKDKLKSENTEFVWQSESPKSITLFSERDEDIDKAKEVIKETICEVVINLDPAAASNLNTASWREEKRTLLQTHEGSIQMSEDSNTIAVAGISDDFQKVIDSIDKFFEIRTVRHVLVPVEVPKVKFLRQHWMSKAKNIERKLLDEKVHIEFEEGSYTSGVKISGLKEGLAKARKEIEKLLDNIKCKDCKKSIPGISTFFKKGNGKEILTGIEHNTNTVICPKEAHRRRKPLRTWTTSAGVVSVVKGDLCQMKVDAIVYAATKDLKLVTGLGKAIAEKGGKDIQEEGARFVKNKGHLSEGDVVCTGSGHLPCKHVLHAMLPKYKADTKGEHEIKTLLINILKKCDKKNIHSIGLPALGSSNGYPLEEVVKVIVEMLSQEWTSSLGVEVREVILCDLKLENTKLFIKTCDAELAGARPRHETTEEDEDDPASSRSGTESDSDSSGSDNASSRGGITVKTGELSKQKADVVVNPTNKELNLSVGAVSKSLLEDGGHGIQTECKEKYPSGINPGEVASTKGGKLKCKEIFHGVLQTWKKESSDRAESVLASLVKKCLKKTDSIGYHSIVFPALGTGKLGFPADVSARLMYGTAADFLEKASSLRNVTFVVHSRDTAVKKAFETEVYGHSSSSRSKPSSHYKSDHQKSQKGNYQDNFKFGCVEVKILQGDITLEKTDCIACCCDDSFELKRGALSRAVLAKAGHNLQEECSSKRDEFNHNKMVMTGAHKLSCKQLLHLKVQSSPRDWGTLFVEGLEKANNEGLKSISIPALGTGGQKMSPEKMASSLRYAVKNFSEKHKHPKLTLVRVVIFQESMVKTYKSVFAGHKPGAGAGHLKGDPHHRSAHGGEVSRGTNKEEDEIVLCVYSDSRDNIRQAMERITQLCKEEFVEKEIGESFEQIIKDLDNEEMSKLCDVAHKHKVVLKRQQARILLQGRVKDVSEVHDELTNRFTDIQKSNRMKEEAKMVANLVQWSYVIGEKSMPFTVGLNCCLEKAYNEKKTTIEIKDVKGREYTVDLKKKVEYPKGGGKPIKIERCEKAIRAGLSKLVKGEKEALAGTKTQYFQLKPERNFKGDAEDLHFRTAESQFYRLLGAGAQYRVAMVEYVVNPGLIKKFRAAKDALKKKHGDDTSEPVLAFHGTNEGNISSICEGGFKKPGDKGFAAATDAGYYGCGVYFSEFPHYSIAYIKGASKLLLCQVILGHVYKCPGLMNGAKLQAGYDSHMSPDGQELIIFDTDCILPCYIVHYDQSAKGIY